MDFDLKVHEFGKSSTGFEKICLQILKNFINSEKHFTNSKNLADSKKVHVLEKNQGFWKKFITLKKVN